MSAARSPRRIARRTLAAIACAAVAASLGACADARQMTVGVRQAATVDSVPVAASTGGDERSLASSALAQTRSAAGAGQATLATGAPASAGTTPTTAAPAPASPAAQPTATTTPAPATTTTTTIPGPKGMDQFRLGVETSTGGVLVKACNSAGAMRVQAVPQPAVSLELRNSAGTKVLVVPGGKADPIGFGAGQCIAVWPQISAGGPAPLPTKAADGSTIPAGTYTLVATWGGTQDGVGGSGVTAQANVTIG